MLQMYVFSVVFLICERFSANTSLLIEGCNSVGSTGSPTQSVAEFIEVTDAPHVTKNELSRSYDCFKYGWFDRLTNPNGY